MTSEKADTISVFAVDDNRLVADALRVMFSRTPGFTWSGSLDCADNLVDTVSGIEPDVVLLDIDMPGKNPFDALQELAARAPSVRVVVFSGHVRKVLVDKAIESGAWGYVSKNDGESALVDALKAVTRGEFGLSPHVRAVIG